MSGYRIGRLGKRFVLVFESRGKRRRFRLNAKDASEAHRVAPGIFAELTRPAGTKVKDLWQAFMLDKAGRAVTATMVHTWKALQQRFGEMDGQSITVADCRAHMAERRKNGIMWSAPLGVDRWEGENRLTEPGFRGESPWPSTARIRSSSSARSSKNFWVGSHCTPSPGATG